MAIVPELQPSQALAIDGAIVPVYCNGALVGTVKLACKCNSILTGELFLDSPVKIEQREKEVAEKDCLEAIERRADGTFVARMRSGYIFSLPRAYSAAMQEDGETYSVNFRDKVSGCYHGVAVKVGCPRKDVVSMRYGVDLYFSKAASRELANKEPELQPNQDLLIEFGRREGMKTTVAAIKKYLEMYGPSRDIPANVMADVVSIIDYATRQRAEPFADEPHHVAPSGAS